MSREGVGMRKGLGFFMFSTSLLLLLLFSQLTFLLKSYDGYRCRVARREKVLDSLGELRRILKLTHPSIYSPEREGWEFYVIKTLAPKYEGKIIIDGNNATVLSEDGRALSSFLLTSLNPK